MEFLRFFVAGGAGAVVNILSRYVLTFFMAYEIAILVAYLFGMMTAFMISKLYVFKKSNRTSSAEFVRFTLVNVFAAILVWGCSVGLAHSVFPRINFTFYPEDIAHIIGVGSTAITSYFFHKYFTFSAASSEQA